MSFVSDGLNGEERENQTSGRRGRKGYAEEIQKNSKTRLRKLIANLSIEELPSFEFLDPTFVFLAFGFFCVFCVTFASSASGIEFELVFEFKA
jgi:hypothetical protein